MISEVNMLHLSLCRVETQLEDGSILVDICQVKDRKLNKLELIHLLEALLRGL